MVFSARTGIRGFGRDLPRGRRRDKRPDDPLRPLSRPPDRLQLRRQNVERGGHPQGSFTNNKLINKEL